MREGSAQRFAAHRPAWLYFIAVMLAYAVVVLSANTPPHFVDYPDWVYQGALLHRVLAGHPVAGYALKPYPVPNSLTTVALGLLDTVLPWALAAKLWVCFYLVLATIASVVLSRALASADSRMIVALPTVLFLNLDFWYGHISFEIGMCLFAILIAMALRGAGPITLSVWMVLLFFTHMEALACALLFLGCWAMLTRQFAKLWAALPGLLLTFWYAIARFAHGNADAAATSTAGYTYGSQNFLAYKVNTLVKVFGYVNARDPGGASFSEAILGRPLFVCLALLSIALAAAVLVFAALAALRSPRCPLYLRAVIAVLAALALVLPQTALGTADPSSRLLLVAVMIALFLAEWRSRLGFAIAALSVLFCAANLWQFARLQHNPSTRAHAIDLPAPLLTYGHVEPYMRDGYYEHLASGQMDVYIFPTGMFLRQTQPR